MIRNTISACAFLTVMLAGTAAHADMGFYYGLGLGYSKMESESNYFVAPATSEATAPVLGLTLGYRWQKAAAFFGAEVDGDISFSTDFDSNLGTSCSTFATGPYWCSHQATLRLRGIGGHTLTGGYEVFGTAGFAIARGESATNPTTQTDVTSTGYTLSAGVQRKFGSAGIARLELIYDQIDSSDNPCPPCFDPSFKATSLKATYLF